MHRLITTILLLFFINSVIAQDVIVANSYTCKNGYTLKKDDTIYITQPDNGTNSYTAIYKDKYLGDREYLEGTSREVLRKLKVDKIVKYNSGTAKEYALIKVNGNDIKNYTIDIEAAVKNEIILYPKWFVPREKIINTERQYYGTNGIKYHVGDTILLSRGSAANGDFRHVSKSTGAAGVSMSRNPNLASNHNISGQYANTPVVIKKIGYYGVKTRVYFVVDGVDFENYILSIEAAISACEIVPCKEASKTTISIADEIKKLYDLKEQGILTEEEYQQQKEKLLSN